MPSDLNSALLPQVVRVSEIIQRHVGVGFEVTKSRKKFGGTHVTVNIVEKIDLKLKQIAHRRR